ncbi:MAG: protein-methionine-sulfoxide reductase catalytic subunit MsrP [Candidatus Aminicenantales bacterium]
MLVKKSSRIPSSEITPKSLAMNRRRFLSVTAAMAGAKLLGPSSGHPAQNAASTTKLKITKKGEYTVQEEWTPVEEATGYTNFYEFSLGKRDVKKLSQDFRTRPWTVRVEGEVRKPRTFDIDELIQMFPLEERVYRWRCVEAWSMVIPWIGFPLASLIKTCEPTSKARFVEFTSVYDPKQMPQQKTDVLDWPYREGLRLDEAVHPLTLMGVGMYGEILPNQNGAPLRLVVPWKYGFKSAKSIVRIRFTEKMPKTTWRMKRPQEYGFYANVNPNVDHPRWTQARERRIGEEGRRKTLMFNGYADEVGHLYSGMDLKKFY